MAITSGRSPWDRVRLERQPGVRGLQVADGAGQVHFRREAAHDDILAVSRVFWLPDTRAGDDIGGDPAIAPPEELHRPRTCGADSGPVDARLRIGEAADIHFAVRGQKLGHVRARRVDGQAQGRFAVVGIVPLAVSTPPPGSVATPRLSVKPCAGE